MILSNKMETILLMVSASIILLIIIVIIWRLLARHRAFTCPVWMAIFLYIIWGAEKTLDWIGLKPGQRVLEIGPGIGRLLIPAARRVLPGGEVVGLDIQTGMIERLKKRAVKKEVSNLTAVLGNAVNSYFPPESFDVIFFCTVLGEIPEREIALKQCYKALKPNGLLSITEILLDPHYQSLDTVKQLAKTAGFRLQTVHGKWYYFTANFDKEEQAG